MESELEALVLHHLETAALDVVVELVRAELFQVGAMFPGSLRALENFPRCGKPRKQYVVHLAVQGGAAAKEYFAPRPPRPRGRDERNGVADPRICIV